MLRFILLILVAIYFGIPFLYEKALATETKIIKMNGQEWLVTIEPGKEPMLKPLEKPRAKVTKLPFVIHGEKKAEVAIEPSIKKEPEWQRRTVKESKIVQTCDDSIVGCAMTPEGDCPDCKTELVQEEKVEVVVKTDFTKFKESVKTDLKLNTMKEESETPHYLSSYAYLRDIGHPEWICWKVKETCVRGDDISIEDLFAGQQNASYCKSIGFWAFDYSNPTQSCRHSTILNL